ncbi:MAG: hypothetical protein KC516_04240 [Nanoarchaeota archaeon]|nr:hypothetical protein [Nanoarchaeota archaeon]
MQSLPKLIGKGKNLFAKKLRVNSYHNLMDKSGIRKEEFSENYFLSVKNCMGKCDPLSPIYKAGGGFNA